MSFLAEVDKGRLGKNKGIPIPISTLNDVINGTQKGRYILVGAESGAGKTTFIDYCFFYCPYYYAQQNGKKIKFIYYSLELSKRDKQAKLCSFLLEKKYKIRISPDIILGMKEGLLEEHYEYIKVVSTMIDNMYNNITFIDENINADGIYKQMMEYVRSIGDIDEEYNYTPHDEELHTIILIDHIGLIDTSKKHLTLKDSIDALSKYITRFRNKFNFTWIVVQQFNTELTSTHRKNQTENSVAPQRLDFGDSKYTYRDADVVIGLVNPNLYGINIASGYAVGKCNDLLVESYLMKNRYGKSNVKIPMLLNPTGSFIELPKNPTNVQKEEVYQLANSFKL